MPRPNSKSEDLLLSTPDSKSGRLQHEISSLRSSKMPFRKAASKSECRCGIGLTR